MPTPRLASRMRTSLAAGALALGMVGLAIDPALATPALQLDIMGGTYDATTQSVVTTSSPFTLGAILTPQQNAPTTSETMFLSAAILTPSGASGVSAPPPIGSIIINGITYGAASFTYGTPSIPTHGVFPTSYIQLSFNFSAATKITEYNVETNAGGWTANAAGTSLVVPFEIALVGFNDYMVHFDLYSLATQGGGPSPNSANFAPFSHDATGSGDCIPGVPPCPRVIDPPPNDVPEPASLALLGVGLLGLGMVTRRRRAF